MTLRHWLTGTTLTAGLLACGLALGRQGVVKTTGGAIYEGEISETAKTVQVTMRGIPVTINREEVASISYPPPFEEQFQTKLAALKPQDVDGRLALARSAFDNGKYDLARQAVDDAMGIDPNNAEATLLFETIRAHMRLESGQPHTDEGKETPSRPRVTPAPTGAHRKVLTPEQIQLIKLAELRSTDAARIQFGNDVVRRFVQSRGRNFAEISALRPSQQAELILREGDPKMRDDIRVLTDPPSIREYRSAVQPMILNGCAAVGCHGSPDVGGFFLYNPAQDDAAIYTNFYLLNHYTRKAATSGMFGGAALRMIDRTSPGTSLLLEFAVPPDGAPDHPQVAGKPYRGITPNRSTAQYQAIHNWIRGLVPAEPNYGFKFEISSGAATKPTTTTAPATP